MKIICEHCGTNINIESDSICPNCKAPYNNNKEFIKYKEEKEKEKKDSMELKNRIIKKFHNTSKIFIVMYIVFFLVIAAGFTFIITQIIKDNKRSTNVINDIIPNETINDKIDDIINENINNIEKETDKKEESNIEFKYSKVSFVSNLKWNGSSIYKAKNGYKIALINISIKNDTGKTMYISNNDVICSINGVIQENVSFYIHDYKELPTTIEAGFIAEGYVAYEVKKDVKTFDLTFKNNTIQVKAK